VNPLTFQESLHIGDGVLAEMEDARGEDGIGAAVLEDLGEVLQLAGSSAGYDWDLYGLADEARDLEIETGFCAVCIDGIEDDFTGAESFGSLGPLDGVQASGLAAAMREDFPATRGDALTIDGDNDALAAEALGAGADEVRGSEG